MRHTKENISAGIDAMCGMFNYTPVKEVRSAPRFFLPFTRFENNAFFYHNTPYDNLFLGKLCSYLTKGGVSIQMVKFTEQDATDFKRYLDPLLRHTNPEEYMITQAEMVHENTSIFKLFLKAIGAPE